MNKYAPAAVANYGVPRAMSATYCSEHAVRSRYRHVTPSPPVTVSMLLISTEASLSGSEGNTEIKETLFSTQSTVSDNGCMSFNMSEMTMFSPRFSCCTIVFCKW